jgi:hypothetical protein
MIAKIKMLSDAMREELGDNLTGVEDKGFIGSGRVK